MDAKKSNLTSLFSGAETKYIIPVYQRNYNWSNKQCRQLFDDICSVIKNENEHFFGSVVISYDKNNSFLVIDGQQRLTTVSLIWIALYKLIEDHVKEANPYLAKAIQDEYCYHSLSDGSLLPRIEHVEKDRVAYAKLIDGKEENYVKDSNITCNFHLFYDWLKASDYTAKDFYDALGRLMVARIELESKDNPQQVFESLNSTGMALSDGDKIRNYMLMNLNVNQQKEYYKNYWIDIERNSNFTGDQKDSVNAVTFFVRDYMTAKTARIPALRDVYFKFKDYRHNSSLTTEDLLAEMKKYSLYLWELENGKTKSEKLNSILKRIALLEMTVIHPFEFNLLDDYENGKLSETEVAEVLSLIETYLFRRLICEVPTNALNKIFATLYGSAKKRAQQDGVSFYQAVVYILVSKGVDDSGKFPDDEEFKKALSFKNIYKMRAKNKIYIFYRLNAGTNAEGDTSVIEKMQPDREGKVTLSIEHIMPQKLNPKWIADLGGKDKATQVQEKWEHTIANLTLTGYNSSYSNNSFQEKLELKDQNGVGIGFLYSPLHINEFVKKQTQWGEQQLQERLQLIQDEAIDIIWKRPALPYTPKVKPLEELTVADDKNEFTGKDFIDGTVTGNSIQASPHSSWKSVIVDIIKMLDKDYHFELIRMANDDSQTSLQNENTKFSGSTNVLDGVYAYLSTSTSTKMDLLNDLLEYLGLDSDSIVFHVEGTSDGSDSE